MKRERILTEIFNHATPLGQSPVTTPYRYVPRSIGGTGWMVWDKRLDRFLEDRELAKIDPGELMPAANDGKGDDRG